MDTNASSFTLRKNAKRAAETMIPSISMACCSSVRASSFCRFFHLLPGGRRGRSCTVIATRSCYNTRGWGKEKTEEQPYALLEEKLRHAGFGAPAAGCTHHDHL